MLPGQGAEGSKVAFQPDSAANPTLIFPDWPAPPGVIALVSTRIGGVSKPPFDSFNLALHVNDDPSDVLANRALLQEFLEPGLHLQWLQQVHGTQVIRATADGLTKTGDAVFIDQPGLAGVVMTADCLPVFFVARDGHSAAVAHAGWRGLLDGVLERTLEIFNVAPSEVLCWMGPAIGPCHFEVGAEVLDAFLAASHDDDQRREIRESAFKAASSPGKYHADLYSLARLRLQRHGVIDIHGGGLCTFCDADRFYSYRRDRDTGRMASVIGIKRFS